jgi:hypothetical protein
LENNPLPGGIFADVILGGNMKRGRVKQGKCKRETGSKGKKKEERGK